MRGLEFYMGSEFKLPGCIALTVQHAKASCIAQVKPWIGKLHMVKNVQDLDLEVSADTFRNPEILYQAYVHIPVR